MKEHRIKIYYHNVMTSMVSSYHENHFHLHLGISSISLNKKNILFRFVKRKIDNG